MATTNQCEICNDRGVIWTEEWAGAFKSALCICHTPEYWAEQSTIGVMLFRERIAEIRAKAGEINGEMEYAGRQEC
jgi:hypothetical protein